MKIELPLNNKTVNQSIENDKNIGLNHNEINNESLKKSEIINNDEVTIKNRNNECDSLNDNSRINEKFSLNTTQGINPLENENPYVSFNNFKKNIVDFFILFLQENDLSIVNKSWLRKRYQMDLESQSGLIQPNFQNPFINNQLKNLIPQKNDSNDKSFDEIEPENAQENKKKNSEIDSISGEFGCRHKNLKHYAKVIFLFNKRICAVTVIARKVG